MFQMLQLVIYVIITLSIPYLGLVFINAILLINTKPAEEILSQAVKNTNFHIQSVLRKYIEPPKGRDMYSDFYTELVHQADKLNAYLNTGRYPNGVQQEGIDFYLWFSEIPDQNDLENWKIQLRQTVRTYDNTLDVLFNKIENKPFLKLKLNLISKETLNLIEHGQPKPLYSEEGEV